MMTENFQSQFEKSTVNICRFRILSLSSSTAIMNKLVSCIVSLYLDIMKNQGRCTQEVISDLFMLKKQLFQGVKDGLQKQSVNAAA